MAEYPAGKPARYTETEIRPGRRLFTHKTFYRKLKP